jgi:integrase
VTRVRTPTYRHNRTTDRAVVTIDGKDHWLGKYGTPESRAAYDRLIAEWLSNGRRLPVRADDLTILELVAQFWAHAETFYRKADGTPTTELDNFRQALRPLKALYGSTPARDFGPRSLTAVRQRMISLGWARTNINKQIGRLKMVFRWATAQELIPPSVYHGLISVAGLQRNRTEARETEPVTPAPEQHVAAVLPLVSRQVRTMIELQLLTGMRPGEVVAMRRRELDTSGEVWLYRPGHHKTAHHGHARTIYLGPKARELVEPFLKPDLAAYLFSPADAEAERRAELHRARLEGGTPLKYGNRPGSNRARRPRREPGDCYTVASYRRAIERACDEAFPPVASLARQKVDGKKGKRWETDAELRARLGPDGWAELQRWQDAHRWHPHQLRHNAATRLRKEFGLEAAQVILGHKTLSVTEVYAEKNVAAAVRIMAQVG